MCIRDSFSLVLSDMRLPDEDGIALLQWMAGAGVAAPVIVMTSYAEIQNAVRCMKLGARDYVAKPVNPDELLKKIREALDVPAAPAAKSASKPAPRAAGSFSEQPLNYLSLIHICPKNPSPPAGTARPSR